MKAERLYTKQPSRTIQQKRGDEGALEMVDNRPAGILQAMSPAYARTLSRAHTPSFREAMRAADSGTHGRRLAAGAQELLPPAYSTWRRCR